MLNSRYMLNPYPWIFGTVTERHFWKKSKIITGDVKFASLELKIISAERGRVGLSYDTNFKWHFLEGS